MQDRMEELEAELEQINWSVLGKAETRRKRKGPRFGVRHVQVTLLFLLLAIAIGMRVHLSVAIVAMTSNNTSSNPDIPVYHQWTNKSVILSSFFWGYMTLQLVAGELGRRYGTKRFLVGGMIVNGTACSLVPLMAAKFGPYGVIACRVAQGVSQGFFYSSVYNLLGCWVPTPERSRLSTIALSGSAFGTIVTMSLVGYICSTDWGWPATFYLYGAIGYAWAVTWYFFGANSPGEHAQITEGEKRFIESTLNLHEKRQKKSTPWKAILTSLPFWSISVTYFGQNWGFTTLSTEMPTYYFKVLGFDINSDGLLTATPYLIGFSLSFIVAATADYLINNHVLSRTNTRKMFTTIGSVIPAISLFAVGFVPEDSRWLSVLLLMLPNSSDSCFVGGNYMTHVDISPNYAGVIMGLSNFIPNFCSILAPLFVQLIVTDETNRNQWRTVFMASSAMFLLSNLFYVIFTSGEVQWWNDGYENEEEKVEEKKD